MTSCFSPVIVLFPACFFLQAVPPGFAPDRSDTTTIHDEKERNGKAAERKFISNTAWSTRKTGAEGIALDVIMRQGFYRSGFRGAQRNRHVVAGRTCYVP
jgi:hypothetical protein